MQYRKHFVHGPWSTLDNKISFFCCSISDGTSGYTNWDWYVLIHKEEEGILRRMEVSEVLS